MKLLQLRLCQFLVAGSAGWLVKVWSPNFAEDPFRIRNPAKVKLTIRNVPQPDYPGLWPQRRWLMVFVVQVNGCGVD